MNTFTTRVLAESKSLKLVREYILLIETIFKHYVGFFYVVSNPFFISFNFYSKIVDIPIQISIIRALTVATLLQVSNLGFLYDKTHAIINLPKFADISFNEYLKVDEKF